jgi:hypothetical protein
VLVGSDPVYRRAQSGHRCPAQGPRSPTITSVSTATAHTLPPIDVGVVELDRLTDPHAGRGEQPDQRLVGRGAQLLANPVPRLRHQRQDLRVAVDERRPPMLAKPDQPGGRDLRPRVDPHHVPRETTHDQQPHPRHRRIPRNDEPSNSEIGTGRRFADVASRAVGRYQG